MLGQVTYVWLYVRDLSRAIHFYRDVLGLHLAAEWSEGASFDVGNLTLGVHLEEGTISRGNSPVITLNANEPIETIHANLQGRKVTSLGHVARESYGKVLSLSDPDGHALLIHEAPAK
jgi:lactoylglutathione lyase